MRSNIHIIMVAILLALCSCTSMQEDMNGFREARDGRIHRFFATMEQSDPATKVYADENMKVLWNAGDLLTVFNQNTYNSKFRFAGEDGDNAGNFEDVTTGNLHSGNELSNIYAVYPYSSGNKINNAGNTVTLTLPAEQLYKEHSFGIDANTMVAVTDNSFLAFKNLGGYLQLRLYGDNVKVSSITLRGNNGEKIAGKASVEVGLGTLPTVTMDNQATDAITLVCDPPVQLGATAEQYTDFWFVIPPVAFSGGFTITVTDDQGAVFQKTTTKRLVISRSTIEWMSPLKVVTDDENAIVHFADDNFKAIIVRDYDENGDGEISYAEALNVDGLYITYCGFTSLEGIEHFINLTLLSCTGNPLKSLDLSHNLALETLWCENTQLTSLDVSKNTELTDLRCYSNQLKSLDLSKNSKLSSLNCKNCGLTSLDVSNNTELTTLDCSGNKLKSLDLSKNTKLTSVICNNNQLASLDVSNTSISTLNCSDNKLTSLSVSNNALIVLQCENNQLTSLSVSSKSLNTLICSNNQLSSLDMSANTSLYALSCDNNQLTNLVISNTALSFLCCNNNQLTALDLGDITSLNVLLCNNNRLTSLDVKKNTELFTLCCENNNLAFLDVSNNNTLTVLDCLNNPNLIVIYLNTKQKIASLTYDTEVTTIEYYVFIPDNNFKTFCLNNFDVNADGEVSLTEASSAISMNVGGKYIASLEGIESFPNLDYLSCSGNQLTSLDVSKNTALTTLHCNNNQLKELDVSNNAALSYLNCRNNPNLSVIWLKTGQTIDSILYDSSTTTIQYKD